MCLFFIALIAIGNLRGVKESGRIFAAPTYLFLTMIGSLVLLGIVKLSMGTLHHAATASYQAGWASNTPPRGSSRSPSSGSSSDCTRSRPGARP